LGTHLRRARHGRRLSPRIAILTASVVLVAAQAAVVGSAGVAAADGPCGNGTFDAVTTTCSYSYTGSEDTFVVPAGVTTLRFIVIGAPGATGGSCGDCHNQMAGGAGSEVIMDTSVTPGDTYYVEVGGAGAGALGGFNGGANGGSGPTGAGGGGGGASDIRTTSGSLDSRVIVAAGGGGAGGGGGAAGGTGDAAGSNGTATIGGGKGTSTGGGSGGGGAYGGGSGSGGAQGVGGTGGVGVGIGGGGGGGGGGLYGGGGGGAGGNVGGWPYWTGAGGGGGSNFVAPTATSSTIATDTTRTPSVVISVPPAEPTVSSTSPTSPSQNTSLRVLGSAPAGTTVNLHTASDCSGPSLGSGTADQFASPGIATSVDPGSTTTFYAKATVTPGNDSPCSATSVTYVESTSSTKIPITDVIGVPDRGDTTLAIDGDTSTSTYTTPSNNQAFPSYLELGFASTTVNRIRQFKGSDYGPHDESIQYTTDTGTLTSRNWANVAGMSNGFDESELLKASAVNSDGTISQDFHNSPTDGWASLSFDPITATGIRIKFSGSEPCCNHFREYEFEAHHDIAPNTKIPSSPDGRNGYYVTDPHIIVSATANTDGATISDIRCVLDPSSPPVVYSDIPSGCAYAGTGGDITGDGTHTLYAASSDSAGNQGAVAGKTFKIDTTPPAAPNITGTTPPSPSNNSTPTVDGTAEDGSTVTVYTDSACTGTVAGSGTATGGNFSVAATATNNTTTTFYATATDVAGNASSCSAGLDYVEDSTAPTITITGHPTDPSTSSAATFTFTASESATFACQLDGGAIDNPCTSGRTYAGLSSAQHTFSITATDLAGNTSAPVTYTWTTNATTTTNTVEFNGVGAASWVVPAGINKAIFDIYGARGGRVFGDINRAGLGGHATATLDLSPGETIGIVVGGVGSDAIPSGGVGGFNGGGQGAPFPSPCCAGGAGGGGATDIRQGGDAVANRVLVAGGGGGGANGGGCSSTCNGGGDGGGLAGNDGRCYNSCPTFEPGKGGDQVGTHGSGDENGGPGQDTTGGGGGGGYFGGTGGYDVGGGGGSGFGPPGVVFETGVNTGDGFVTISYDPPAVTSADHVSFTTNVASQFDVITTGTPTPAITETGALPSGVTLTDNGNGTATLGGTPPDGSDGTYPIAINAVNGNTPDAAQNFTLTVTAAPLITSTDHTTFNALSFNTFTVTTGGTPTPSLTETGALPSGVSFVDNNDRTATLSGTPTDTGTFPLSIKASNGAGPDSTQSFTLTVPDTIPPAPPDVTGSTPASPANNNSPSITGTAEDGSTVQLYTGSACNSAVSGGTATASGGTFSIPVTVADDTTTTFSATATDAASNVSGCSTVTYTYVEDSTPPAAPSVSGTTPASPSNNASPSITGTAEDGSTVKLYTDASCTSAVAGGSGTATGGNFSIAVTVSANSSTDFYATATDAASNVSTCSTTHVTYVEDETRPDTTIVTHPNNPTNSQTASFTFQSSKASSTFTCQLDTGGAGRCDTGSVTYNNVSEGQHTFTVFATDAAGNSDATPATFTWTVDITGPTVTIDSGPANSSTSGPSPSFSFSTTASDQDHFECKLDGGGFSTCTSPDDLSGLAGGSHTFSVHGVDTLGNVGADVSRTWTVDATGPTVTIDSGPADSSTSGPSPSFSFSTTALDNDHFVCTLDSTVTDPCTSPQHLSGLAGGSHTFSVHGVDTVGNVGADVSRTWTVDATPPAAPVISGPHKTKNRRPTFKFSDSDPSAVTFTCTIDTTTPVSCALPSFRPATKLKLGRHTLVVTAFDAVGNSAASTPWTFKIVR